MENVISGYSQQLFDVMFFYTPLRRITKDVGYNLARSHSLYAVDAPHFTFIYLMWRQYSLQTRSDARVICEAALRKFIVVMAAH